MDRIDLAVDTPPVTAADLALPAPAEALASNHKPAIFARRRERAGSSD